MVTELNIHVRNGFYFAEFKMFLGTLMTSLVTSQELLRIGITLSDENMSIRAYGR